MIWTRGLTHLASSFAVWRLYTQFLGVGCDGKVDAYRYLAGRPGLLLPPVPRPRRPQD
jgi:hypothetical protein